MDIRLGRSSTFVSSIDYRKIFSDFLIACLIFFPDWVDAQSTDSIIENPVGSGAIILIILLGVLFFFLIKGGLAPPVVEKDFYYSPDKQVKLTRGFDIKIKGAAANNISIANAVTFAIKPTDFIGMIPIPKMIVEEGAEVKAGDALFFDKTRPEILYTAPISGEVVEIKRGEKRAIVEVVILADKEIKFKPFNVGDYKNSSREQLISLMLESGTWCMLRQRPYNTVADFSDEPRDIFISGFDSAPLAPDYNFTLNGDENSFQAGVNILKKLTPGKVFLGLDFKNKKPSATFANAKGVEKRYFEGPHPSGNIGIQIHHISPIKKGDIVWHIHPQDVVILGRLFLEGRYNTEKIVALAGSEVKEPQYYKTYRGACIENMVNENLASEHVRYISGNVLTGKKIEVNGHMGFYDNMVSVIEEGDRYEMFGWLLPTYARPSLSPTFPWSLMPWYDFDVNTNTHGEKRAFVVTGEYEKVLPMDIHPVHLIKAIMANDFEQMEGLGIYEVDEEDMALCEFVCTSKIEVQKVLREGLEYMREQGQ